MGGIGLWFTQLPTAWIFAICIQIRLTRTRTYPRFSQTHLEETIGCSKTGEQEKESVQGSRVLTYRGRWVHAGFCE